MTMKDLPSMYAAVCAKRPELAASVIYSNIIDVHDGGLPIWGWFWQVSDGMGVHVHHSIAAALILARWVEALPDKHALTKLVSDSWAVWTFSTHPTVEGIRPTPLEALAAYYLGDTQ